MRRSALLLIMMAACAALVPATPAPAQGEPCAAVTPARPPVAGKNGFIFVAQPNPCPPGGARADWDVHIDFGDGTETHTPFQGERYGLWMMGANHTYRRPGTYHVIAVATNRVTGESLRAERDVLIKKAPKPKKKQRARSHR